MNETVVDAARLRAFVADILVAVGVEAADAAITADVLVTADLRGHESHGVARLEQFYVRPLRRGQINPRAHLTVRTETAAMVVLDAQNGLGQPAAARAMDLCIEK